MYRFAAALTILVALPWAAGAVMPSTSSRLVKPGQPIAGSYPDEELAGIGRFTLPRTFLYDRNGALIPQEKWPDELLAFKRHAGDAFCCVSDAPAPADQSGPPPDCKIIVYGTDVRENFKGLLDKAGHTITYESLPKHKYLLVEYYATWCQPCVTGRKALESFFKSPERGKEYVWVSIDMSRLADVQKTAKRSEH
jgi:hypothetical protein